MAKTVYIKCKKCKISRNANVEDCPVCVNPMTEDNLRNPEHYEKYRRFVEDKCYGCLEEFKNTFGQYMTKGNFCSKCNQEINQNIKSGVNKRFHAQLKQAFGLKD